MDFKERVWCGSLRPGDEGREVMLAGWVDALRDHGEVLFAHLRDRSGIVQAVFSPERSSPDLCRTAESLKSEYCLVVRGRVEKRLPGPFGRGRPARSVDVWRLREVPPSGKLLRVTPAGFVRFSLGK